MANINKDTMKDVKIQFVVSQPVARILKKLTTLSDNKVESISDMAHELMMDTLLSIVHEAREQANAKEVHANKEAEATYRVAGIPVGFDSPSDGTSESIPDSDVRSSGDGQALQDNSPTVGGSEY